MAALPGSKNYVMVSTHGGACCGMSHIHDFGTFHAPCRPENVLSERKQENYQDREGRIAMTPATALWVTTKDYPEQTALERLKAAIKNVRTARTAGIIEITLMPKQLQYWRAVIEALGFKCVTEGHNSNTGNLVRVFHLVYSGPGDDVDYDEDYEEEDD